MGHNILPISETRNNNTKRTHLDMGIFRLRYDQHQRANERADK